MNMIPRQLQRSTVSFRRRRKAGCDSRRQRLFAAVEHLEPRHLLAGLVLNESVFDSELFAQNLEEQIPVDPTGPNGVVGYSYSIIDGDPENPISGQGGIAVMPWDGPISPISQNGVPIFAGADRAQEIASPSKVLTAAAVMHLLQEQILLEDPGLNPGDLAFDLQTAIDEEIVNYLPAPWAAAGWSTAVRKFREHHD